MGSFGLASRHTNGSVQVDGRLVPSITDYILGNLVNVFRAQLHSQEACEIMIKMLFCKYKPHQGEFVKSVPSSSPTKGERIWRRT
jgi:hypothetical protein